MSVEISMVELRRNAASVLRRLRHGQRLVLTHRGKRVARLEPLQDTQVEQDDPFLRLEGIAGDAGESLSNHDIDELVYGG